MHFVPEMSTLRAKIDGWLAESAVASAFGSDGHGKRIGLT
jgi:hypothetical protein